LKNIQKLVEILLSDKLKFKQETENLTQTVAKKIQEITDLNSKIIELNELNDILNLNNEKLKLDLGIWI